MSGRVSYYNVAKLVKCDSQGHGILEHESEISLRSDGNVWYRSTFYNGKKPPKFVWIGRLYMPSKVSRERKCILINDFVKQAQAAGYTVQTLSYSMVYEARKCCPPK